MVKRGSAKGFKLHKANEERRVAAAEAVPALADVVILGGGASGLTAAIEIKRRAKNAVVVVLEAKGSAGTSLLVTGNGRCNITNAHLDPEKYRHTDFTKKVFKTDPLQEIIDFFMYTGLDMFPDETHYGNVFPRSRRADSVQSCLVETARASGVQLATLRNVSEVKCEEAGGFRILYEEVFRENAPQELVANNVVVAGNAKMGVEIAEACNLKYRNLEPLLVPLKVGENRLSEVTGTRVYGVLLLANAENEVYWTEPGEILLQGDVVSGIPALNASRHTGKVCKNILLQLFPDLQEDEVLKFVPTKRQGREIVCAKDLYGLLPIPVANALMSLGELTPQEMVHLIQFIEMPYAGLDASAQPQVMGGGVDVSELNSKTLEVKRRPGLYMLGDAVDNDGPCGGFNLSFAWISGMRAGRALGEMLAC